MPRIVVVGPIGRDLMLRIEALPDAGGSAPVERRRELLGGKGANQAVACRQLGATTALVGVVGDDDPGRSVLAQAEADGIDVTHVVQRHGASTALLVDVLQPDGIHRLLEDIDPATGLTADEVSAGADIIRRADAVLIPLQQTESAILRALAIAPPAALVVADGAPANNRVRDAVLGRADVLRADSREVRSYLGDSDDVPRLIAAARTMLTAQARLFAFGISGGDAVVWQDGEIVLRHAPGSVDPTGAGDSFVAALTVGLLTGVGERTAAEWASAAAGETAAREGARPDLDLDRLRGA